MAKRTVVSVDLRDDHLKRLAIAAAVSGISRRRFISGLLAVLGEMDASRFEGWSKLAVAEAAKAKSAKKRAKR